MARKLCQRCGAEPVPTTLVLVPKVWTVVDPAGVRWREWWLCASCAEEAHIEGRKDEIVAMGGKIPRLEPGGDRRDPSPLQLTIPA